MKVQRVQFRTVRDPGMNGTTADYPLVKAKVFIHAVLDFFNFAETIELPRGHFQRIVPDLYKTMSHVS